jgi:hypothetical protein
MDQRRDMFGLFKEESSREPATQRSIAIADLVTRSSVSTASTMLARVSGTGYGQTLDYDSGELTKNDIAILRFLSALELIESDVWQQYEELGGVKLGSQDPYRLALQSLDDNLSHFITSCALDEISHTTYLTLYLESEGVDPVNLDRYRTLRGSRAAGALNFGQLTNLQHLNLDLGVWAAPSSGESRWKDRYLTPDADRIIGLQSIPSTDADLEEPSEVRVIAKTALLHFGYLENLVSKLYVSLSQRIRRVKILEVTFGIGGNEIAHYHASLDLARNVIQGSQFLMDDSERSTAGRPVASSPYFLERERPTRSLHGAAGPDESVRRPAGSDLSLAAETIARLAEGGLFIGQSPTFTHTLFQMAHEADRAIADTLRRPISD